MKDREKLESVVPVERIEKAILLIRGQKVMLDSELAQIYGTTTKRLNEQVKRNLNRFPEDFMFQLSDQEFRTVRSQFATTKSFSKTRVPPYAFTEHGAVMLASVLSTPIAVNASIQIVRAFVRLREMLLSNKELSRKLSDMERKYDAQFKVVFRSIHELMKPVETKKKGSLGFRLNSR